MDKTQLNNALMPSLALPQQVEIVPVSSTQVQRTVYDPNDIIAMRKAIQERNKRSSWEALSNALGSVQPKTYTGAYGVEVSNPLVQGIASALQGFDKAYTARKDAERQLADDEFELAKMMAEANKRAITTTEEQQAIKRNISDVQDPKSGVSASIQALVDQAGELYGQYDSRLPDRASYEKLTGPELAFYNISQNRLTASPTELAALKKFDTMKKQSVVELRQQMKGQGAITDNETDLLRMMEKASSPYEFQIAGEQLLDMWNRRRVIELSQKMGIPVQSMQQQQPVQQQVVQQQAVQQQEQSVKPSRPTPAELLEKVKASIKMQ